MKHLGAIILSAAASLALGAGVFAQTFAPRPGWSLIDAERVAGESLFKSHCASCHVQATHAKAVYAPSLLGVAGRPAGSLAGFPYSDALKKSGLTWTDENLRKWVSDSAAMVPGTLMPHVEIKDPAETIYIVEYLKTLKAPAKP